MLTACPACYNLIKERVDIHRRKMVDLRTLIDNIGKNPKAIDDTDFRRRLDEVNDSVMDLLNDARKAIGKFTDILFNLSFIILEFS